MVGANCTTRKSWIAVVVAGAQVPVRSPCCGNTSGGPSAWVAAQPLVLYWDVKRATPLAHTAPGGSGEASVPGAIPSPAAPPREGSRGPHGHDELRGVLTQARRRRDRERRCRAVEVDRRDRVHAAGAVRLEHPDFARDQRLRERYLEVVGEVGGRAGRPRAGDVPVARPHVGEADGLRC